MWVSRGFTWAEYEMVGDVPAVELDDDFARAVVVDFFEFANVACEKSKVSDVARRLNVGLQMGVRERVRSSHGVGYIGHLKGKGRVVFKGSKPLPSYQPEWRYGAKIANNASVIKEHSWHIPCFCITLKNLTITLELGRMRTWRFPAFSALLMALSASLRTLVLTILRFSARWWEVRYLEWGERSELAIRSFEHKECP